MFVILQLTIHVGHVRSAAAKNLRPAAERIQIVSTLNRGRGKHHHAYEWCMQNHLELIILSFVSRVDFDMGIG